MVYTTDVQEDENGELVLELPIELINQMGWTEETLLEWEISEEGVSIKEKKDA